MNLIQTLPAYTSDETISVCQYTGRVGLGSKGTIPVCRYTGTLAQIVDCDIAGLPA